jgi:hypothetical protein
VIEAIKTLRAIAIQGLVESISAFGEADPGHRVTGLEEGAASRGLRRRRRPALDEVVDERVVRPLGDLMAKCVGYPVMPSRYWYLEVEAPGQRCQA